VTELVFLPAGDATRSGDAIVARFDRPDTGERVHLVVDAGYDGDGRRLVLAQLLEWGADRIDLAVLTHPDPDHVGGMIEVLEALPVGELWAHRPALHGDRRTKASGRVERLVAVAAGRGVPVVEPWTGARAFGGALRVLGPDRAYYEGLLAGGAPVVDRGPLVGAMRWLWERLTLVSPRELRFSDEEGVSRWNNAATVLRLSLPGLEAVLTADTGVPALGRAWDGAPFDVIQVPHHGSKRNASSALLDRVLGPTGRPPTWTAVVSVAPRSLKHPSPRVLRAWARRGCLIRATAGDAVVFGAPADGSA